MPKRKKTNSNEPIEADYSIHQPTDKLFKKVFEYPKVMHELIKTQLPSQILQHLDFSTLKIEKGSFVNKHTMHF